MRASLYSYGSSPSKANTHLAKAEAHLSSIVHSFYHYKHPKTGVLHHPFIGVDIETFTNKKGANKGKFYCAGLFGEYGNTCRVNTKEDELKPEQHIKEYFRSIQKFQKYLLSLNPKKCILAFFNLNFDYIYLKGIIQDSLTIKNAGNSIIEITLLNGLKCWDIKNHSDQASSLEDWIDSLKMKERWGIYKADLKDLKERVMNDAAATFHIASYLEDEYVYKFGIPFKSTSGQEIMQYYAEKYFTDMWIRKEEDLHIGNFAKEAYFGPRNENWDSTPDLFTYRYDMNGAYASIMAKALIPDPTSVIDYTYTANWEAHLYKFPCGIFKVKVKAPKMKVMVLPVRNKKGELTFPYGTFTGTWTNIELKEALANGYKVLKCYRYLVYRKAKPYFKGIALDLWQKKQSYASEGNKCMANAMKGLINRLYGKFAQRNLVQGKYNIGDEEKLQKTGMPFRYGPDGTLETDASREPVKAYFPEISAFITSNLRVLLFKALKKNEDNLIYCACDSIHTKEKPKGLKLGVGLGEWKEETAKLMTHFNAGNYQFEENGKLQGHVRGVPTKRATFHGLDDKGKQIWTYTKPLKEHEAQLKGKQVNEWVEITKHIILQDHKKHRARDGTLWPLVE